MYRPRVLLAEDHPETAERLRNLLRVEFDVIDWVEDGRAEPYLESGLLAQERLARVAETRGSRFVVVRLLCDIDELLERVVTPSRRERMKSVSADYARQAFERGVPELAKWDPLTIDVTHRSAADTAGFILRQRIAG